MKTKALHKRAPLYTLLPLEAPLSLFIDPSDACNFTCDFCFRKRDKKIGSVMGMPLFQKIIDDISVMHVKPKMLHLYGFGEPLLNKNIAEFVSLAKWGGY